MLWNICKTNSFVYFIAAINTRSLTSSLLFKLKRQKRLSSYQETAKPQTQPEYFSVSKNLQLYLSENAVTISTIKSKSVYVERLPYKSLRKLLQKQQISTSVLIYTCGLNYSRNSSYRQLTPFDQTESRIKQHFGINYFQQ